MFVSELGVVGGRRPLRGGAARVHRQNVVLEVALLVRAVRAIGAHEGLLAAVDHEVALEVVLGISAVKGLAAEAAADRAAVLLRRGEQGGGRRRTGLEGLLEGLLVGLVRQRDVLGRVSL